MKRYDVLLCGGIFFIGFSFTEDEAGYARSIDDVSRDLYIALVQFFQLFPDFQSREFYIAGESYAGKGIYVKIYVNT